MSEKDRAIIGANLKYLRRKKGLTQQQLANELGIRRSSIGAYEERRATPKHDTLKKMSKYFGVSIDTLLKENLSTLSPEELKREQDKYQVDVTGKNLRVLQVSTDMGGKEYIDLITSQKAAAGYLNGYADPEFIEEQPKIYLPNLERGTYRAFEINGDSMLPLKSGTIIICEYVPDWRDIKDGQTYVIISDSEGIVYKRVVSHVKEEGGFLEMHSDNQNYSSFEVPIQEVREVWKAKLYISSDFPDPDMSLEKLSSIVMDIQQEVIRLKSPSKE